MSKTNGSRRLKPVQETGKDSFAIKLLTAMVTDLEKSEALQPELAAFICGRARARDYMFLVKTLPEFVGRLAADKLLDNEGVFQRFLPLKQIGEAPCSSTIEQQIDGLYLVGNFLKKYKFQEAPMFNDATRAAAALRSFKRNNKWCGRINRLAKRHVDHPLIAEARRVIGEILPPFNWEQSVKRAYFGPGVNVGVSWAETDAQVKFYLDKTMTPALARRFDFAAAFVPTYLYYEGLRVARGLNYTSRMDQGDLEVPHHSRYSFMLALGLCRNDVMRQVVPGSIFFTAPKDAQTDRGASKQPLVNSFLQNGIGKWLAEILASFSDQLNCRDQERNRSLAFAGSSAGVVATIDLSSASDTVSFELVRSLLPSDWFRALRLARSPQVNLLGEWVHKRMFSTMGNGFTFPLETLIFYAISTAAVRLADPSADLQPSQGGPGANREPSVYGDDIIVCNQDAPVVLKALRDCGFWPNLRKSFHAGPFRESCGHDYRHGRFIRPVFLKRPLLWKFDVISLINHLSNPAGFGWYTMRYGTCFRGFAACLVEGLNTHGTTPAGPVTFGKSHEVTYVRLPLGYCRRVGAVRKLDVCEPGTPRGARTTTEMFFPLRIVTRKFKDVTDIGPYLKGLCNINPDENTGQASLYTRVKRGEVTVELPRLDQGVPVLGWTEYPQIERVIAWYWPVLQGIRWFKPAK